MCRSQVKKGLINQANGEWKPDTTSMAAMMKAGYHLR